MLDVASPVIQVVTTGTDWPAIAAVISTGIVGLAGIGATLWQAKRNWNIEDKRAKVAERRRIYASSLASFFTCLEAARRKDSLKDTPESETAAREYDAALIEALNTAVELRLIAPSKEVGLLSTEAIVKLRNYVGKDDPSVVNAISKVGVELQKDLRELES